jgi:hypothetical protein
VTRVLTILAAVAAVAALAVSAAPAASAGPSKAKVPRPGVGGFSIDIGTSEKLKGAVVYNGHAGLGANAKADGDVAKAVVTDNKDPDKLGAVRTRGSGVIASVNVKYT